MAAERNWTPIEEDLVVEVELRVGLKGSGADGPLGGLVGGKNRWLARSVVYRDDAVGTFRVAVGGAGSEEITVRIDTLDVVRAVEGLGERVTELVDEAFAELEEQ